jgi:hypothetical protein
MPQYPYAIPPGGTQTTLNVTASTAVKTAPGKVFRLVFNTASTTAPAVYDSASVGGIAAANLIWQGGTTTAAQSVITLEFPCLNGITVVPGGATVAVSYA